MRTVWDEPKRQTNMATHGRRGPQRRPTKVAVSLRLTREVVERFKAGGPGWQTRIDEALKKAAGL